MNTGAMELNIKKMGPVHRSGFNPVVCAVGAILGAAKGALAGGAIGVAGGADGCADTYQDGEWCWFTDSCSLIISYYDSGSSGNSEQGQPIPSAISDSDAFNNDTFYDPSDLDKSFICQWTDNVID